MRSVDLYCRKHPPLDIVLTIVPDDFTTSLNAPPAPRYGAFLHLGTREIASWQDELP